MWKTPASGGATVLKPGKNLASRSERAPWVEKRPSVLRTQESGSREILHSNCKTLMPFKRPIRYQTESAHTAAKTQTAKHAKKFRLREPASAPAASNSGSEGTGRPICSAKTQASKTL